MTPVDSAAPAAQDGEEVGSKVGPYRLVRVIGRGGMGVVHEAIHERIGQRAAVKLLAREGRGELAAAAVRRFLVEARALSRVEHPGLVRIFDCGETAAGAPWISMEYVDGETLRARLSRRGGLPVAEAARSARQMASALSAVHRAGVVHRDLKPDNVMIVADDEAPGGERVKLLDFGIAKLSGEGSTTTTEGSVLGTAGYMAPEQCAGSGDIDARADVYALGVVLHEMLAGRRPFEGDPASVMRQHLFAEPRPIEDLVPGLPKAAARVVRALMAKEPTLRIDLEAAIAELRALEAEGTPSSVTEPARVPVSTSRLDTAAGVTEPANRPVATPRFDTASAVTEPANRPVQTPQRGTPPAVKASPAAPVSSRISSRRTIVLGAAALVVLVAAGLGAARLRAGSAAPVALPGMVRIAGGTFRMGSTDAEIADACATLPGGCAPEEMPQIQREKPAREVTVSAFQIDAREVTNRDYAAFLNALGPELETREDRDEHYPRFVDERKTGTLLLDLFPGGSGVERAKDGRFAARAGRESKPVSQVTWDGASRYCRHLGKRLPTEAEWEMAARGPGGRRFPWGNEAPRCEGVVFGRGEPRGCPSAPAELQDTGSAAQDVTPEGVHDLGGNAGEWVQDQFVLAYYPDCGECRDPVVEQPVPAEEDLRIFRGGTLHGAAWFSRATTRSRWKRTRVMDGVGFRCASR